MAGLLAALLAVGLSAAQGPPTDPAGWLLKAAEIMNIRASGMPPFQLKARVRLRGADGNWVDGTYELLWNSPSQWREEVHAPGYARIRVGGQNKYWQRRSLPNEVIRIWQLDQVLNFKDALHVSQGDRLGRIRDKKEKDRQLACVEKESSTQFSKTELCFDAASSLLVREQITHLRGSASEDLRKLEYALFQTWAGKSFPHQVSGFDEDRAVVELNVEDLAPGPSSDAAAFAPSAGAEEWQTCDQGDNPVEISRPEPIYPQAAITNRVQGTVWVYAVIETDGSLSHLTVVGSAGADLDRATLEGVARWRYKPVTCQGVPLRSETLIHIAYTMGG